MKLKRIILIATSLALVGAGATVGGRLGLRAHQRRMSGRPDLDLVSCNHCHGVSLKKLPWAKSRPHHDAPGGIVVSPDGKTLFIALDDRDEIAEADFLQPIRIDHALIDALKSAAYQKQRFFSRQF